MLNKDNINGMLRKQALELLGDLPAVRSDYVCADGRHLNTVIFVLLPKELWRKIDGGCCCRHCSRDGKAAPAFWDTAALRYDVEDDAWDHVWTVHAPELHGGKLKRQWWEAR